MAGELVIIGAGGHGRVCADVASAAGFDVVGFCDSAMNPGGEVNAIKVVGRTPGDLPSSFDVSKIFAFAALGDNARRMDVLSELKALGFRIPILVHPTASISPSAELGEGTVVVAQAAINANAKVGSGCILNTACSIDHDNVLGEGVQVCPGVHAAGGVVFGEQAFIGTGASIVPGVRIGARAIVAAGAVVTSDVPDGVTVSGVPASPISDRG
jgi:sugar O-acyltransferase (sialic acid O-acetyltransferase NeuD family)